MDQLLDALQHLSPGALVVLTKVGQLLVVLVVTLVALRLVGVAVGGAVGALLEREAKEGTAQELSAIELTKRRATLESLGDRLLRSLIVVVAGLTALSVVQVNVGPAIAGFGIAGIAIGLGAQGLVRDVLAGTFILIENQFGKGDVVRIADVEGTVEDFSLRRTTLRDLDGTVHTVPNGLIRVTSNLTRIWARIEVELKVALGTDLEAAGRVVDEVARAMTGDPAWTRRILEAPRVEGVSSLAGGGVTLQVLGTVRAGDRWAAAAELRRRIATAFAEAGLQLQA
ncbi:MAG TPA: mechanosensitive ion channel family protein [Candidatus Limnocylindrales bacterium]|nr:mechanosensitive ion channel family protein [Candidatus Limnocylindrales bacterium]